MIHSRSHRQQGKELQVEPSSDSETRAPNECPSQSSESHWGSPRIKPLALLGIQAMFRPSDFGDPLGSPPLSLFPSTLPSWPTLPSSPISPPWVGSSAFSSHSTLSSWLPEFWVLSPPPCTSNLCVQLSANCVFAKTRPPSHTPSTRRCIGAKQAPIFLIFRWATPRSARPPSAWP